MLGAMDSNRDLTPLGRVLLQIPVEAAIGKLCLYGSFFRCLDSALTLAAILTNRDPFLAPIAVKEEANAVKDSFTPRSFRSDPLAVWVAYNEWVEMDDRGEYHRATQFCHDNFLSKTSLLQIKQVKKSLLQSLDQAGVIAVSAGGAVQGVGRRGQIPPALNEHNDSLPLLAALIAMASAPNFAIRTSERSCRTSTDKIAFINASSVNARRREIDGPEGPSASFNPAEKRLYAFIEKSRSVPAGGNASNAMTQLRGVTRLDPLTYLLFGAYSLRPGSSGLECDNWLPVRGNRRALDDVRQLKELFDRCMLRVFEGVSKSLTRGRDQRNAAKRDNIRVRSGSSRIEEDEGADEAENESGDEEEPNTTNKRVVEPLGMQEIKELEMLTTDVVKILDGFSAERESGSRFTSRPPSRHHSRPSSRSPSPSSRGVPYGRHGGHPNNYDRSARW